MRLLFRNTLITFSDFSVRVVVCIVLAVTGFLVVAFSQSQWMSIMGVVVTSLSSGLGEVTFLQYSSFYEKYVSMG